MAKDATVGYTNAIWNLLEPFTLATQGVVEYVAIEVLVGQLVRVAMGMPYNWMTSSEIHLLSVPAIGTLNFGDAFGNLVRAEDAKVRGKKEDIKYFEELAAGAKGVPGVIAGYIASNFVHQGMKIPSFANRDFTALVAAKILSRPITKGIFDMLPADAAGKLEVLNALFNRQRALAQVKGKGAEDEDY